MAQAAVIQFNQYRGAHLKEVKRKPVEQTRPESNDVVTRKAYGLNSLTEIKDVMDYMLNSKMYIHYLIFGIQLNTGRRISDIIGKKQTQKSSGKPPLKWSD